MDFTEIMEFMEAPKQGWFTRMARKNLKAEWEEQGGQLGVVNRQEAKKAAWKRLGRSGGLTLEKVVQMFHERFNIAEVVVLKNNQKALRKAIVDYRNALEGADPQQSFEGFEKDIEQYFGPIVDYWIKDPGPDEQFDELRKIGDLDFVGQFRMSQVREEKSREVMLSVEDYQFMETRRKAEGLPQSATINQIIARAS